MLKLTRMTEIFNNVFLETDESDNFPISNCVREKKIKDRDYNRGICQICQKKLC